MNRLDVDGLFWLVNEPNDKVAGRLRFDPVEGARLGLIGKFRDFIPSGRNPPVHINALAGGRLLTLLNCHFEQVKVEYVGEGQSGLTRHEYRSDLFLDGLHRDKSEPMQIKKTLLHLRYLEKWIHALSTGPIGYEDRADDLPRISHEFDVFKRVDVMSLSDGELGLSYGQVKYGDQFLELIVRQNCYFDLRLEGLWPFDKIMDWCWMLQDLVTLGCDYPSAVTGVTFEHAQQNDDAADESRPSVRPYMRTTGHYTNVSYEKMSAGSVMFTYNDIGGMEGVSEWLKVASRFRVVVGSLVGNLYAPSPYPEIRFFNACTAAEAFQRVKLGKQRINLFTELLVLAQQVGDVFKGLVGNVDDWAKQVVQSRNNSVAHPGLHDEVYAHALDWLADSLHLLVVLCLLEECGVREKAEERIKNSSRAYRIKQIR